MSLKKIVYDLETQRAFDEVGRGRPEKLGVSIVVVYDYTDNQYKAFHENELNHLWQLFESADLIIGFNHKNFDNKVLAPYYGGDLSILPHLDLLEEFYKAAHFRVRLDALAEGSLGRKKSGHGLQAIQWFKQGNFKAIEDYCRQDVELTQTLYEYALANNSLKFQEINEVKEVALDTSGWATIKPKVVNYTLPF